MKAVILARVSSKEQEEGHSLDAQINRLQEYCRRKELNVINTFTIVESSVIGSRKAFNQMLDFCKKQKQTIALVADAVDRVQRSFKDSIALQELINKKVIELHFYREGMIINTESKSSDIMRWDFSVMAAKSYVLQLSENVKRSLDFKLKNGEYTGEAPLGYINSRDEKGKATICIDENRGYLVTRIFERYSEGLYSLKEIANLANKWGLTSKRNGLPMSANTIHHMLNNPFYCGIMLSKGQKYPHIHPKLISQELFSKCQNILHGKSMEDYRQFKSGTKPFIFKGLIKCGICGTAISSDMKIKPSGKSYTYLFCSHRKGNCQNKAINEEKALEQIRNVLKSFQVPQETFNHIKKDLEQVANSENEFHTQQLTMLRGRYDKIQLKLKKLRELLLDEKISPEDFNEMSADLKSEQFELENKMKNHTQADEKFSIAMSTIVSLASNAYNLFMSSNIDEKRELINLIFSNLKLINGELRFSLRSPFDKLTNLASYTIWGERWGSNPRQPVPQTGALPTELRSPLLSCFTNNITESQAKN